MMGWLESVVVRSALAGLFMALAACIAQAPPSPTPAVMPAGPSVTSATATAAAASPQRTAGAVPITLRGTTVALAIDVGARQLYVRTSESVVLIDLDRLTTIASHELTAGEGSNSTGIAVDRERGRAYVTGSGQLYALSLSGGTLRASAPVELGGLLGAVAVDERTHRVFVLDHGRGQGGQAAVPRLLVVNGDTGQLSASIPLGSSPTSIAVSAATGRVYVSEAATTRSASALVRVFDADSLREVTTIGVSQGGSLVLDEPMNTLYMTSSVSAPAGRQITLIDARNAQATTFFLPGGVRPNVLGVDPTLGHLYLGGETGTLDIALIRSDYIVPSVTDRGRALGGVPVALAVDPRTHRAFVLLDPGSLVVATDDLPSMR